MLLIPNIVLAQDYLHYAGVFNTCKLFGINCLKIETKLTFTAQLGDRKLLPTF